MNSPVALRDPIQTRKFMALVPIAALAALAGTTAALYQSAERNQRKNSLPITSQLPRPTPIVRDPVDYSNNQLMATRTNKKKKQTGKRNQRVMATRVVKVPTSGGVIFSNPTQPNFRTYGDSTIVRNTEIVANINFNATAGLFSTFSDAMIAQLPSWLTPIADNYSKWRWRSVTVIYIPSCPTSTSGRVAMSMAYDRNDAAPASVTAITQGYRAIVFPPYAGYEGAHLLNSGRNNNISGAIFMDVDVSRFDKAWYPTINGTAFSALSTTIQNIYCPCSYVIGSDGGPAGATAGSLYLKYEIEFIEPINPTQNV